MLRVIASSIQLTLCGALALVGATSCLCPPCPTAPVPGQSGGAAAPAGERLVIWDGDGGGIEGGQSWADCDKKPDCKAKLEAAPGVGRNGSMGLAFHAEGPQWNGFGWNWFGWYPETAGTDISPYQQMTFWIRVEAESPDKAPAPDGMAVSMGCSAGKKNSADAQVTKFAKKDVMNGEWHQVIIPLREFYKGKEGKEFDPRSAWEFRFATWSPSPRKFVVYFDEIAVENPK
jgi:hypothetical protein